MKHSTEQSIRSFLSHFQGDPIQAVLAIKEYSQKTYRKKPAVTINARTIATVSHVSKRYKLKKQTVTALADVSFSVQEGEIVAITGPSGSGKSTLLQLLGGLDAPSSGKIIINDVDISTLSDSALSEFRNRTIGFIFQFFHLQPFLTLRKNIDVPVMFSGKKSSVVNTTELLTSVGLDNLADHLPSQLSGGQIQRAAIARALINKPRIILADEPTGNLDSKNSHAIIELLRTIRDTANTTIIIVTHDQSIARLADREIVLEDGVIA